MFFNITSLSGFFISVIATFSALFVAMPFHEFAHAYVAKKEGDYTAVACKRYTLAPFAHFDAIGFIWLILFGFGWAKPVPIDSRNFKNGRKSLFKVAVAGIVMNFLLGTIFLFIYIALCKFASGIFEIRFFGELLYWFLAISVSLNFMLALFNLLPIYPLDGYRIIDSFCKTENNVLIFLKKYSFLIFIVLIFSGLFDTVYNIILDEIIGNLTKFFVGILGG